ncbi:putative signal peptide protein [Halorubrum sp. AJ67]|nr:putative signal peptide protein [Halorubrum sp. AJ67]
MNRRNFLLGSAGALGTVTVGSVAYTSATATRTVDVRVEADDSASAALRLEPGPAGGTDIRGSQLVVTGETDDKYTTPDGSFVFGDGTDPTNVYAFRMTNNLTEQREYALTSYVEPETAGVGVSLFDINGNELGSSAGAITAVSSDLIVMETTASLPGNTGIDITVYEDTDPNDDAAPVNEELVALDDGTNTYELQNIDFDDGNELWFEAEFTTDDTIEEDPSLSEVTLRNDGGDEIQSVDNTGEVVVLDPGQVAYAILAIETSTDDTDISGIVEISSSANEDFS